MSVLNTIKEDKINNILNNKRLRLSDIYDNYKYRLIGKDSRENLKNELIKSNFITEICNKKGLIIGYNINKDNKNIFKAWLNDNLI